MGRQFTGKAWIKPTKWKNSLQEGPLNIVPCCRGSPCHSCKVDMADGMRYTGSKLSQSGVTNVLSLTGLQYRNEGGGGGGYRWQFLHPLNVLVRPLQMGYSRKNTLHPHPPMDGKLEILVGGEVDSSGNRGGMGGSELKNYSSGVTFNFNLDRYILTT